MISNSAVINFRKLKKQLLKQMNKVIMQPLPSSILELDPLTSPVVKIKFNQGYYANQYLAIRPEGALIWYPATRRQHGHTRDNPFVYPINAGIESFHKDDTRILLIRKTKNAPKLVEIRFNEVETRRVVAAFVDNIVAYYTALASSSGVRDSCVGVHNPDGRILIPSQATQFVSAPIHPRRGMENLTTYAVNSFQGFPTLPEEHVPYFYPEYSVPQQFWGKLRGWGFGGVIRHAGEAVGSVMGGEFGVDVDEHFDGAVAIPPGRWGGGVSPFRRAGGGVP